MKVRPQNTKSWIVKGGTVVLVVAAIAVAVGWIGRAVYHEFQEAEAWAQYSAQAALLVEIERYLEAVPAGGEYPRSLDELPLTYPDGGDPSLLELFEYESDGTRCTLRTRLNDRRIVESYPRREAP